MINYDGNVQRFVAVMIFDVSSSLCCHVFTTEWLHAESCLRKPCDCGDICQLMVLLEFGVCNS